MNKEELYKKLIDSCHWLSLNMNDTFHYACADTEQMDASDAEEILPIFEKYGYDALVAYVAIKRGYDPKIPVSITKEFKTAKEELLLLAADGTILYEQFYDRTHKND